MVILDQIHTISKLLERRRDFSFPSYLLILSKIQFCHFLTWINIELSKKIRKSVKHLNLLVVSRDKNKFLKTNKTLKTNTLCKPSLTSYIAGYLRWWLGQPEPQFQGEITVQLLTPYSINLSLNMCCTKHSGRPFNLTSMDLIIYWENVRRQFRNRI